MNDVLKSLIYILALAYLSVSHFFQSNDSDIPLVVVNTL